MQVDEPKKEDGAAEGDAEMMDATTAVD